MSLFIDPYIKTYNETDGMIILEVYFMEKQCGYINITSDKVNSIISCGIKSFKGVMKRDEIYFDYANGRLEIIKRGTSEKILRIKCSEEIYIKIK
jgi:hypothetical protein